MQGQRLLQFECLLHSSLQQAGVGGTPARRAQHGTHHQLAASRARRAGLHVLHWPAAASAAGADPARC